MARFTVLVVEDAVVTSVAITRALEAELPDPMVHRAQSMFEARLLLKSYDIDFFILDIRLPDGSGIDLLADIAEKNPCAGVIVVTASPLPRHRVKASDYGVLHFMEKPVDPRILGTIARQYMNAGEGGSSDTSFTASLKRLTATDAIQLKCLSRATVRLDFTLRDARQGSVYLEEGEIIHATTAPHPKAAGQEGVDAFREILLWRGGKIDELPLEEIPERTIDEGWQGLILKSLQWADEMRATENGIEFHKD